MWNVPHWKMPLFFLVRQIYHILKNRLTFENSILYSITNHRQQFMLQYTGMVIKKTWTFLEIPGDI